MNDFALTMLCMINFNLFFFADMREGKNTEQSFQRARNECMQKGWLPIAVGGGILTEAPKEIQ